MTKEHTSEEIKYRLSDLGAQIGNIAINYITELEKENAELKEVHESDKRSLALIAKKSADFEKAYNEAEELLDKQTEATYKLFEENKELKEENEKSNVLLADIIEAFTSCSYNDDFEMAQAGREIYELFNGGKDPKEVFHNAEVPKSSRQLLKEAKELIRQLCSMVRELNKPNVQLTNVDYSLAEAEQFISEVEK